MSAWDTRQFWCVVRTLCVSGPLWRCWRCQLTFDVGVLGATGIHSLGCLVVYACWRKCRRQVSDWLGQGKCDRWLHPEISWFSFFALWVVWTGWSLGQGSDLAVHKKLAVSRHFVILRKFSILDANASIKSTGRFWHFITDASPNLSFQIWGLLLAQASRHKPTMSLCLGTQRAMSSMAGKTSWIVPHRCFGFMILLPHMDHFR